MYLKQTAVLLATLDCCRVWL